MTWAGYYVGLKSSVLVEVSVSLQAVLLPQSLVHLSLATRNGFLMALKLGTMIRNCGILLLKNIRCMCLLSLLL